MIYALLRSAVDPLSIFTTTTTDLKPLLWAVGLVWIRTPEFLKSKGKINPVTHYGPHSKDYTYRREWRKSVMCTYIVHQSRWVEFHLSSALYLQGRLDTLSSCGTLGTMDQVTRIPIIVPGYKQPEWLRNLENHLSVARSSPCQPWTVDHCQVKIVRVSASRLHTFSVCVALIPHSVCLYRRFSKKVLPPFWGWLNFFFRWML